MEAFMQVVLFALVLIFIGTGFMCMYSAPRPFSLSCNTI